jgi:hypothetical protein
MVLTGNIRAASLVVLLFTAGCAGTAPQGQDTSLGSDHARFLHWQDFPSRE